MPRFQSESKCETFLLKISLICIKLHAHFHMKDFVLRLVSKQRYKRTRKWPIDNRLEMFALVLIYLPLTVSRYQLTIS